MPLARSESSISKRKASSDDDESQNTGKKSKISAAPETTQPTNKVLPESIHFPEKLVGTWRIASWNVSGLVASQKKGFNTYVEAEDADILILTETKVNKTPDDAALKARYPYQEWSTAEKKGYAGTAVLSKYKPLTVTRDLPGHPNPASVKGRIVTLEFERFYLIATYVVNAGTDLKTLPAKEEWNNHFTKYIRELDSKKPVVWGGDLNVAPTEKDLTHAKRNWNKTPGYTESETTAFAQILDPPASESSPSSSGSSSNNTNKFVDVWRRIHPDLRHYSYFSYRFNCRAKSLGWRLDMFVLSERILENARLCEIRSEIYGASDHCPVVLEIDGVV